jgi:hypothetical protein
VPDTFRLLTKLCKLNVLLIQPWRRWFLLLLVGDGLLLAGRGSMLRLPKAVVKLEFFNWCHEVSIHPVRPFGRYFIHCLAVVGGTHNGLFLPERHNWEKRCSELTTWTGRAKTTHQSSLFRRCTTSFG